GGGFAAVWLDNRDGSGGVFAQRFDANGDPVGADFQVNTYTLDYQGRPEIAAAGDGSFVVTWLSNAQDGDNLGIFAQRYDSNGQAAGAEFQVNSYTFGYQGAQYQGYPTVGISNGGAFVVAWPSGDQDGDGGGVFAQRFDSAGNKAGAE